MIGVVPVKRDALVLLDKIYDGEPRHDVIEQ